jgi:hypothetical protein
MSGTRRADLLRAIVVREDARIDHALGVMDGLLNGPGEQQGFADRSGGAELSARHRSSQVAGSHDNSAHLGQAD